MKQTVRTLYESPQGTVLDLLPENVLCLSQTGNHDSFEQDDDDEYVI